MDAITSDESQWISGTRTINQQRQIVTINNKLCEIFVFKNEFGKSIATISVIYKGGKDSEYKIRNIQSYIYNIYVIPKYRGKGYIGYCLELLTDYLRGKGISEVYIAVSGDNLAAVRAYEKFRFKTVKKCLFHSIFKNQYSL